jgi:hypothetical protein
MWNGREQGFDYRHRHTILGADKKIAKSDNQLRQSVCLSDRMEQLGSHWTDLYEI